MSPTNRAQYALPRDPAAQTATRKDDEGAVWLSSGRRGSRKVSVRDGSDMRLSELEAWYTPSQAAARIGLSRQYVTRLAEDGQIRSVLVGRNNPGGRPAWILNPASVEAFASKKGK